MAVKKKVSAYLVLSAERNRYNDTIQSINIKAMRKAKPALEGGEVAIKIELFIDPAMFEEFIPVVKAELEATDLIVPEVLVEDQREV